MIGRIFVAVVIGVFIWIVCSVGGDVLASTDIPVLKTLGNGIHDYAIPLGFIAAVIAFFTGWTPFGSRV